jgi:TPR repeat protein
MDKKNAWVALALAAAAAWAQPEAAPAPAEVPVQAAPPLEAATTAPQPEPTWNELLAAGQYPELEQRVTSTLEAATADLASYRVMRRAMTKLVTGLPQTRERFDQWVAATGSGTAHLARGEFLEHRGFEARGGDTAGRTAPEALERMADLLTEAGTDFEAALEKVGPRCDLCYAGLIDAHMALGERGAAAALVDKAMQALDGGIAAPRSYLFYLAPQWGGSVEHQQRFVDRFAAEGPQRPALPLLRGAMLVERSEALLRDKARQEQGLLVAQQAAEADPGNAFAWQAIVMAGMNLERAPLVLEASEKALALDPDLGYVLNARASVLLRGPTPLDAVPFLERAVAHGDEWALKALLPIVAAGQHGFKPDRERAQKICQSAIDALMPAGFACMGGLEYFGMGRPANKPRALQWFLEAADRGVNVAMVDAALMLLRADGVPRDEARAIGLLLRARTSGEPRADGHLRGALSATDYVLRVQWPELQDQAEHVLREDRPRTLLALAVAIALAGSLFWGFVHNAGHRPARRKGAHYQLAPGWLLRAVVVGNLVVAGLGVWFAAYVPIAQRWWAWPVLGLVSISAAYLLFAVLFTRIRFDEEAVHHWAPFAGRTTIRFEDLAAIGRPGWAQNRFLEARNGARIYVSQALRGARELLDKAEAWSAAGAATQPVPRR